MNENFLFYVVGYNWIKVKFFLKNNAIIFGKYMYYILHSISLEIIPTFLLWLFGDVRIAGLSLLFGAERTPWEKGCWSKESSSSSRKAVCTVLGEKTTKVGLDAEVLAACLLVVCPHAHTHAWRRTSCWIVKATLYWFCTMHRVMGFKKLFSFCGFFSWEFKTKGEKNENQLFQ